MTAAAPDRPGFVSRHRWKLVTATIAAALAAWLAFGYFGVQTLFIDDEVDDAMPVFDSGAALEPAPPDQGGGEAPRQPPADPSLTIEELATGEFVSRSHSTSGRAVVLGDGSDQRFLRFEGFSTENGPELHVYLSTAAPDADEGAFDDDFVDLGGLRGNVGDQNYELPPEVDLSQHGTVVIWCVRFSVAFGAAELA